MHFCLHFCFASLFFHFFSKLCSPPSVGSTILKNGSKQSAFKNDSFEPLLGALALAIPLRWALFRQWKCCSCEGLGHFFDLGPFCTHDLQFIFAISVIWFKKFDFWCLLAWLFFIFKIVLPALSGKHIFEERCLQISCARGCFHTPITFKTTTYGRAFPPCAVQIIVCFAEWAENGPLWKLCLASLLLSHAF